MQRIKYETRAKKTEETFAHKSKMLLFHRFPVRQRQAPQDSALCCVVTVDLKPIRSDHKDLLGPVQATGWLACTAGALPPPIKTAEGPERSTNDQDGCASMSRLGTEAPLTGGFANKAGRARDVDGGPALRRGRQEDSH
ncbi:hypothetical protein SKAU_G00198940 [Synaphobranchus kaupii]|uniref:Uncharacterized protein n=1 Tax=Synaphobranchus kaupii TaxID=118154 RepID=A0A9Q1IY70_SYNKA|nr:hypothetical protein SKAU_G00198940 [Synaphobranchus kaupii]